MGPVNLQQTLAASPAQFNDGSDGGTNFSTGFGQEGRVGFDWGSNPTTTNSTQYQFVDDLSWLKGTHNLKFGFNFKRYDVTDGYPTVNTYAGYYTFNSAGRSGRRRVAGIVRIQLPTDLRPGQGGRHSRL